MGFIFCLICFGVAVLVTTKLLLREFIKPQNGASVGYKTSIPSSREPMLYKNSIYRDKASTYICVGKVDGKYVGNYIGGGFVTDDDIASSTKQKKKAHPVFGSIHVDSSGSDASYAYHDCSADCHHSH